MATYYLTSAGSNIAPYDTEATGANSIWSIRALPTFSQYDTIILCTDVTETTFEGMYYYKVCSIQAKEGLSFRPKLIYSVGATGPMLCFCLIGSGGIVADIVIKDIEFISDNSSAPDISFDVNGGSVTLNNVILRKSHASSGGAGLLNLSYSSDKPITLENCLIECQIPDNIACEFSEGMSIKNCTFVDTTSANHCTMINFYCTLPYTFSNNTIYYSNEIGPDRIITDGAVVSGATIDHNIFYVNGSTKTYTLMIYNTGTNTLNVDPIFGSYPSVDQYLPTGNSLAFGYCPGKINCGWTPDHMPSVFYIGGSGDETYPYNTPDRACRSFSRLFSKFDTMIDYVKARNDNNSITIEVLNFDDYMDESTSDTINISDVDRITIENISESAVKVKVNEYQPLFNFTNVLFTQIGAGLWLVRDSNQGKISFVEYNSCKYVGTFFKMTNSVESNNKGYTFSNVEFVSLMNSEFNNIAYPIYSTSIKSVGIYNCVMYSFITGIDLIGNNVAIVNNIFYGRGRNIGTNTTSIKWTETADQILTAIDYNDSYNVNTNAICTYVGVSKMGVNNISTDPLFVNAPTFLATTSASPCRTLRVDSNIGTYNYIEQGLYTFDCGTSASATLNQNEYTAPVKISITSDAPYNADYFYAFVWEDSLGYHFERRPFGVTPVINVTSGSYDVGVYLGLFQDLILINYDTVNVTVSPTSAYTDADDNWKLIEGRNSKTLWDARDNVIVTETIVDDNTASTTSDTNFKFALRNNAIFSTNGSSVIPNSSYRKY